MQAKRQRDWLDDLFDYGTTHPFAFAFASPKALLEARMIEAMDKARRTRRTRRNGAARRRKAVAA